MVNGVFKVHRESHTGTGELGKVERLERCGIEFLTDLAFQIELLPKNHWSREKEKIAVALSKKLSKIETEYVFRSYLLCLNARKIVETLSPYKLEELTKIVKSFLRCDEYLQEIVVGKLRCDLVGIRGSDALAIEIKSANDKLQRALNQVKYYQLWAKEVYLAYDSKHAKRVGKLPFRQLGIGLIEISNSGNVKLESAPERNVTNGNTVLSMLPLERLKKAAIHLGISTAADREELVKSLLCGLKEKEIDEWFVSHLRTKVKFSQEKAAIGSGQI